MSKYRSLQNVEESNLTKYQMDHFFHPASLGDDGAMDVSYVNVPDLPSLKQKKKNEGNFKQVFTMNEKEPRFQNF